VFEPSESEAGIITDELQLVSNINCGLNPSFGTGLMQDFAIAESFLDRKDTDGDYVFTADTRSAYIKEFRRLFIFCANNQKRFSDIDHNDTQQYVTFLKSPPSSLIGKKMSASSSEWKPFYTDNPSGSSVRSGIAAVKSLWTYMQKLQLIGLNPWSVIVTKTNKVRSEEALRRLRILPVDVLRDAMDFLDQRESTRESNRNRWLFIFFIFTGSRISDVTNHGTKSFEFVHTGNKTIWVFNHVSKGGVFHSVPVPSLVIEELKRYRESLGKVALPSDSEPLVFNVTGKHAVKDRSTTHRCMKEFFEEVANYVESIRSVEYAIKLREATTHWLKHSFVKLALDVSGGDIRSVSAFARHADWKTTKSYDFTELDPLANIADSMTDSLTRNRPN
jgi:site-specific recombinase XerD